MNDSKAEGPVGHAFYTILNTHTKLFSSASNGDCEAPNTAIDCWSTGQPGALPLINGEAIRKAVQFGRAIQGTIAEECRFDRRFRFSPDSPCNFQVTQYYHPLIRGGVIVADIKGNKRHFAVSHAYLEEEVAGLLRLGEERGIDYNQAGVPRLVIVMEACPLISEEIAQFSDSLSLFLQLIGISDGSLVQMPPSEESSFRYLQDPDLPAIRTQPV